MQALNLAATAGALLDALPDGLLPAEPELEPHAAASRETALSPATIPNFPLTGFTSSARGGLTAARKGRRLVVVQAPAGQGKEVPKPPGIPEG
jgi:hypothetical protein